MSFTLTELRDGSPINSDLVNDNFKRIISKFDQGLTNADFAGANVAEPDTFDAGNHGISTSLGARKYIEKFVTIPYVYSGTAFSALSSGAIAAVVPIPGSADNTTIPITLTDVWWICNNTGDGSADFRLRTIAVAGGSLAAASGVDSSTITISNSSTTDDANSGKGTVSTSASTLPTTSGNSQRALGIVRGATSSTGCVDAAGNFLIVVARIIQGLHST